MWFVLAVMAVAALTRHLVLRSRPGADLALVNAVGVLIIACPLCAMGPATPTDHGGHRGAEMGVLFRARAKRSSC